LRYQSAATYLCPWKETDIVEGATILDNLNAKLTPPLPPLPPISMMGKISASSSSLIQGVGVVLFVILFLQRLQSPSVCPRTQTSDLGRSTHTGADEAVFNTIFISLKIFTTAGVI